ncbi:MAG: hypothetical protein AB8B96_20570 [Lysobacterales bacterium]
MEENEPIETNLGILRGRNCIFLDEVDLPDTNTLILRGGINGALCTLAEDQKEYPYKLIFRDVLAFKMVELESSIKFGKSCFDLVKNSDWITEVSKGDKFNERHNHYFVQTYDEVFEVISEDYSLEIKYGA